ncbi:MAG: glycosyltransferase family 4 protein [Armatimonadota bacterium]
MKVAMVVETLHKRGGVERRTFELVRELLAAGHGVEVYANRWDPEVVRGFTVRRVPMLKLGRTVKPVSFSFFADLLVPKSPDVLVHTQARIKRYDVATLGVGCHRAFMDALGLTPDAFHRTVLGLEGEMFRPGRYRRLITNSRMCKEELVHYYGVPSEKITVVHNGVDCAEFSPERRLSLRESARAGYGLAPEDFTVLYVGAGFRRKGLDTLVRAAGLSGAKVLVVGRGGREEYDRLAEECGASIVWAGESREMSSCYAAADVFALPTRYDPFANSTLEALASGLPVVTTKRNGVAEILSDGADGFVIQPNDHEALAERLAALSDPSLRERMGARGRETVQPYTWKRTAEETLRAYDK